MGVRAELVLAVVFGLGGLSCQDHEGSGVEESRTVRPPSAFGQETWRPMRVRPAAMAPLEVRAQAAHLALIRDYLGSADPAVRARVAARLQGEIGAEATARAIPRAIEFKRFGGRLVEGQASLGDSKRPYLAVLPEDYDPSRAWPMHIDLHGGGSAGTHMTCLKHWGTRPGPFIVLCPTTTRGHWWFPEGEETAMAVLMDALGHFNVDTDKVSVGGLSNGGNGTWHLGHKYPWVWSALVPRCAGHIHGFEYVTNLIGVPIFMIHGDSDSTIGVDHSRQMFEQFRDRGRRILYTEVEGGGHAFFPSLNDEVAPWLMNQARAIPSRFAFVPTPGHDHGIIHWLEVEPPSPLRAELTSTDEGTRVTVTTRDPAERLHLYLNEAMADLGKPVAVVYNNKVVLEGPIEPSAEVALSTFARTRDPRRTFTAHLSVTLR